jgi:hypothetical protein
MHPLPIDLREYANAGSDRNQLYQDVGEHVTLCPLCREYVSQIEDWNHLTTSLPGTTPDIREFHFQRVFDLRLLVGQRRESAFRLAADSPPSAHDTAGVEGTATLYCENPELVLHVARDRKSGRQSLHLIGPTPAHTARVLIRVTDPPLEFVTDEHGVAVVGENLLPDPATLQWQVKVPDATFELQPLRSGPDIVISARELELAADPTNRIRVRLEARSDGIALEVTLLEIGGRTSMEKARVVVSQPERSHAIDLRGRGPCTVSGLAATDPIEIRVFAD